MNDRTKELLAELKTGPDHIREAADLIETLLLIIEQKDRELAGMSFLLTSAQSDADRFKRERDELLSKWEGEC